jgi:hypothetical protein
MPAIFLSIPWNVFAFALIEQGGFWTSALGSFMIALWFIFILMLAMQEVANDAVNRLLDESSIGLDSRSQRRASLRAFSDKEFDEKFANKDDTDDKPHQ